MIENPRWYNLGHMRDKGIGLSVCLLSMPICVKIGTLLQTYLKNLKIMFSNPWINPLIALITGSYESICTWIYSEKHLYDQPFILDANDLAHSNDTFVLGMFSYSCCLLLWSYLFTTMHIVESLVSFLKESLNFITNLRAKRPCRDSQPFKGS